MADQPTIRNVTLDDSVLLPHASQQVVFKVQWDEDWELVPECYCSSIEWALNPSRSTAQFVYKYDKSGNSVATTGRVCPTTGSPVSAPAFVKVSNNGLPDWYGYVVDDSESTWAGSDAPHIDHSTAFGLPWLLDQVHLTSSVQIAADATIETETVPRALPVNLPGGSQYGNMHQINFSHGDPIYVYSRDLVDAKPWTAKKFLEYVFREFGLPGTTDGDSDERIPVRLDLTEMADWDLEPFDPHGMTYAEILDHVIDRRRALAWTTEIEHVPDPLMLGERQPDRLVIRVVSSLSESVTIGSADASDGVVAQLLANKRQLTCNISRRSVRSLDIRNSITEQADVFEAIGERCGFVGTFSLQDNDSSVTVLSKNWTDALELQYEAGFSGDASYAGLDNDNERAARNSAIRGSDAVRDVFRSFRVPESWASDGRLGDGANGVTPADRYPAFPVLNDQGAIEQGGVVRDPADLPADLDADTLHWPLLRFEPEMPLVQGVDYSGDAIYQGTATTPSNTDDRHRFLPPLVLFNITRDASSATYWAHGERMTRDDYSASVEDGINYSVDVDVRPDAFSFELNVVGEDQHFIASADFADLSVDDWTNQQKRAVDFNSMAITAYVLVDRFASYSTPSDLGTNDVVRRKRISVPGAHMDWIPKHTVTGLGLDGQPQRTTASGWIRNDIERLERVAKVAAEYHRDPRRPVTLRVGGLLPHAAGGGMDVGELLLNIGEDGDSTAVNSLVTKITYQFAIEEGSTPETIVETSHGELDVVGISQ